MDGKLDQVLDDQQALPREPERKLLRREDKAWLAKIRSTHGKYVTGLNPLYQRIKSNEEWWRLHNESEEQKETEIGKDGGFVAKSSWLANVVISKQADGVDAYPQGTFLPREQADQETARGLSKIVPCILELTGFPKVWSKVQWRKDRHGAAFYKVTWDRSRYNGLGEIDIQCVNPLNLAWQPTCVDIQASPYFFHQEYVDRDTLIARYPEAAENVTAAAQIPEFYTHDENRDMTGVMTVVECYYKVAESTAIPGVSRNVLHYVVYTGDVVLYASEDDPDCTNGWYHHGLYPYHIDVLFPDEGSAFGRGYIDLGKSPQTQIDLLNTAFLKNGIVGALPRWLAANGAKISIEDLLDTSKAVIPVEGSVDEAVLRQVEHKSLDGNYLNLRDSLIDELRETTGNTDSATGNTGSGVTAASAIAALQEASGKVSRSANSYSYWVFADVLRMVVELIRQFYTLPRMFRITGEDGSWEFTPFDNRGLAPQKMPGAGGGEPVLRKPEFDVIVSAQKASSYTRMAQNELALQFYHEGFFDPAKAEQAIMCLEMMDFDGKEELLGKIRKNAQIYNAMLQFAKLAMQFAPPEQQQAIGQVIMQVLGGAAPVQAGSAPSTVGGGEPKHMAQARAQAQGRTAPQGG